MPSTATAASKKLSAVTTKGKKRLISAVLGEGMSRNGNTIGSRCRQSDADLRVLICKGARIWAVKSGGVQSCAVDALTSFGDNVGGATSVVPEERWIKNNRSVVVCDSDAGEFSRVCLAQTTGN